MPPRQEPQLKSHTIALMIAVALLYDALQAILNFIFLGWLVSPAAFLTFYVWFKMNGIKFATPKRSGIMGAGFIIELIPILNTLPAWTLAVVLIVLDLKTRPRV